MNFGEFLCKIGLHKWTGEPTIFGKMDISGVSRCMQCPLSRRFTVNGWIYSR